MGGLVLNFGHDLSCIRHDGILDDELVDPPDHQNLVALVFIDFTALVEPFHSGSINIEFTVKCSNLAFFDALIFQRADKLWC